MTNAPLRRSAPRACFICQNSCSASTTLTGKCKTTYKSKSLLGSAFRAETKHCVLIKGELTRGAPFASTVAEPVFKRFNGPSYSSNQIYAARARARTHDFLLSGYVTSVFLHRGVPPTATARAFDRSSSMDNWMTRNVHFCTTTILIQPGTRKKTRYTKRDMPCVRESSGTVRTSALKTPTHMHTYSVFMYMCYTYINNSKM